MNAPLCIVEATMKAKLHNLPESAWNVINEAAYWIDARYGGSVNSVKFVRKQGYWLGVVEAEFQGERLVAFITAPEFEEVVYALGTALNNKLLKWNKSKFPPLT